MFGGFPAESHPLSEQEGYEIQALLHELLERAGHGTVTGHKIGCTTPTMQAYLNIPRPAGGGVLDLDSPARRRPVPSRRLHPARRRVRARRANGPDLDARSAPFDRAEIAAAVDSVMAAIEIVDDRYADWGSLGAIQLIADDFFGAGCVLGAERELGQGELDLTTVSARMTINGVEVGAGVGADILGDPLTALMWLVNEMAPYGHSFRGGSFVLLGSLVQTHWVEQDDVVVVENVPLGSVTARFELGGLVGKGPGGLLHDPVELVGERNAGRDGPCGVDAVRPGGDDPLDDRIRAPAQRPEPPAVPHWLEALPSLRSSGPTRKGTDRSSPRPGRRSPRAARSSLRRPFAHR